VSPVGDYLYFKLFGYVDKDTFRFEQWRRYWDDAGVEHVMDFNSTGTIDFGAPMDMGDGGSTQVPDAPNTLGLLAMTLSGFVVLSRVVPKDFRAHSAH
jgi:hypothetical protein